MVGKTDLHWLLA